jgi:enoyl-[acyl-carrier protein] reductase I
MMPKGGSMLTLTYYGAEKVMPHYNVMGVAKAALEASVRYLAEDLGKKIFASMRFRPADPDTGCLGIGDFRYMLKWNEYNAPLRRTGDHRRSGRCGSLSFCPISRGDHRRNHACRLRLPRGGMKAEDAPDIAVAKNESNVA